MRRASVSRAPSLNPPARAATPGALLAPLADAVLAAQRSGTLAALLQAHPRLARGYARRLLPPLWVVAGDALPHGSTTAAPWQWLLRALLSGLRPDRQPGLDTLPEAAWLPAAAPWRPLLALACHHGLLPVAQRPARYRAGPHETSTEQLCGLWDVAPSTVYRAIERGRRQLDAALAPRPDAPARLAHLRALQHEVYGRLGLATPAARAAWHHEQAGRAGAAEDGLAPLWHRLHAGDGTAFAAELQARAAGLPEPDLELLLLEAGTQPLAPPERAQLALAEAALERARGSVAGEARAAELALRLAHLAGEPLLLGRAYGALGRFHEVRNPERAYACFQDSAEFLRQAGVPERVSDPALLDECANTLVRLAWWHLLRNDGRAEPLLQRAQALQEPGPRALETQALLAQAWGEFWRRSGHLQEALLHKYRALHCYQRLDDRAGLLKTYGNLALIHGEAKDFARAIECSERVLEMARSGPVEPEIVAATHLNVGAAYYWQNRWDAALAHYGDALRIALDAGLVVVVGRAHYNLAEAFYRRFQALGRPDDELQGDAHTAAALATWPPEGDAAPAEATRRLKRDILGPREHDSVDRLLPGEFAAHFPELLAVQRQRAALALPLAPHEQAGAHLSIAAAYLAACVKEREAAAAVVQRHGLEQRFRASFERLGEIFQRSLSREERLAQDWQRAAADLLGDAARAAVLAHLLRDGALSRSQYAPLAAVGSTTASKHLGLLVARGLLRQSGRGPGTSYRLADAG